jgi:hypothetical protein
MKTVYIWDSMDDQDRHNTLAKLETMNEWTIRKTRDKHGHQSHETQEVFRMLGENYLRCSNRSSGVTYGGNNGTTVGKDAYTVDLESNEKLYWLGTESGLLGAFGFEGACTAGDGSCDPPTRSMGMGFCNFSAMQWNTTTPLPQRLLQEQRIRESSKVGGEEEGLSSNRPELVALRECLESQVDMLRS